MATVRLQLRRGTAAQWTSSNPILAAGEMGVETDTRKVKIGDGTSTWTTLDYVAADVPAIGEIAQDAINDAFVAGTGITKSYDDSGNTITVSVDTSVIATKAELAEVSQDSVNDAIVAGVGLDKVYDDNANTITLDIDSTVATLTGTQTLTNKTLTSPAISTPTGIVKADVGLSNVDNTSDADKPVSTATQAALNLKAATVSPTFTGVPLAPTATAQTNTEQIATTAFVMSTIGSVIDAAPESLNTLNELANALADDANFSATVTSSLALKAPLASPTFTGTVSGVTATMVGLGNVNNTSDANKPVSTATQTALDLKAPLASPTFTGTVTLPESTVATAMVADGAITSAKIADGTIVTADLADDAVEAAKIADAAVTTDKIANNTITAGKFAAGAIANADINAAAEIAQSKVANLTADLALKAPLASPTFTGTVSGITATMVGLGNVNNTSDANKPVSTATQTALDLKAPLASPTFTGTVTLPESTVATAMVADGAITSAKIADGTIVTADLADGAVATAKIPDGAITSAKIADATIVNADINAAAEIATSKISGLDTALNAKLDSATAASTYAPIESPTFTGTVSGVTQGHVGLGNVDNTSDVNKPVSTAQASAIATAKSEAIADATSQVSAVIASAPAALDTLDELAAALGDDASFATTITNSLSAKAPLADPTFTGTVTVAASGIAFTDGTQTKEGVPSRTEIVQAAGAYNLSTVGVSLRDEMIEISHTGGSSVDVTVPLDSTTDFPIGTSIDLLRTNSGKVRVVGAAGVTVNATPGAFLREQWSGATLFKRAANTWVLLGDLATS